MTYYHLLFDRHEVVLAEGAWSESLYTGPEALRGLTPEAREEMAVLFPSLITGDPLSVLARPAPVKGRRLRQLVARHRKNDLPLFS